MTKVIDHYCGGYQEAAEFAAELRATGQFKKVRLWTNGEGTSIVTAWA